MAKTWKHLQSSTVSLLLGCVRQNSCAVPYRLHTAALKTRRHPVIRSEQWRGVWPNGEIHCRDKCHGGRGPWRVACRPGQRKEQHTLLKRRGESEVRAPEKHGDVSCTDHPRAMPPMPWALWVGRRGRGFLPRSASATYHGVMCNTQHHHYFLREKVGHTKLVRLKAGKESQVIPKTTNRGKDWECP